MGIKNYYTFLKNNYPSSFKKIHDKNTFNNIYIDGNHLLHNCIHSSKNIEEFKTLLFKQFDQIFYNYIATDNIIIATDGPSVFMKIMLQRKRRMMMTKLNTNVMNLTSGTHFMSLVDEIIKEYLIKLSNTYRIVKPNLLYIESTITGEGELKIFNKIDNNNHTHLIISNDADAVVLAVANQYKNIYLLVRHGDNRDLISVNDIIREQSIKVYTGRYNKLEAIKFTEIDKNIINIKDDLTVLSIFMGNDYLPKIYYTNNDKIINSYIKTYSRLGEFLIVDGTFNKKFLFELMTSLLLDTTHHQYQQFNLDNFDHNLIHNYLEGVVWCMNMYKSTECSKYDFYCPEHVICSPVNIIYYMIFTDNFNISLPRSDTKPLKSEYYPILLMPYSAKKLIPEKYHKLMDTTLKYLYDEELCKTCKSNKKCIKHINKKTFNIDDIKEILKVIEKI